MRSCLKNDGRGDRMTREQALNYMRSSGWSEEQINTVTDAFTCDDAISRQAVLELLNEYDPRLLLRSDYRKMVEDLPSVTPQQKTAHWISWYEVIEKPGITSHYPHCKCSACGTEYDPHSARFVTFCHICGAKMEGVEE